MHTVYDHHLPLTFPYVADLFPEEAEELIRKLLDHPNRPHKGCSSFAITADSQEPGKIRMWLSVVSYNYLKELQTPKTVTKRKFVPRST